jgi:protein O-mannosyl-transferase
MRNTHTLTYGLAGIVIAVIALVYWPVVHANFVWDDVLDFVQMSWLRSGDEWRHYIFRDFNNWQNYFRPLVVAFFTLQVRLFNDTPGPMHAVSLVLHLIDTLLVGLLSWHVSKVAMSDTRRRTILLIVSMALYGLHPVLVEPVVWIGCQFDLAATLFMLLALLANAHIQRAVLRAITVAILFFLAACSKESAAVLPLIMAVFEWALSPDAREGKLRPAISSFIKQNGMTYAAMFLAGITYLLFRHWGLGLVINPTAESSSSLFARLQEVCFIYLHYWKILFWPMQGMGPLHEFDVHQFDVVSASSLLVDAAAILIFAIGFYFSIKRASPVGCIVMAMTAGLLPVLHITSIAFAPSFYHERYLMTSLAVMCAMLPLIRLPSAMAQRKTSLIRPVVTAIGCLWLLVAVINIRATLPLWSNNISLWQWALANNPDSINAKDSLLSAYIDAGDYVHAHQLINGLLADHVPCTNCMLNAAILFIRENDPAHAAQLLERVKNSKEITASRQMFRVYLVTTGQMLTLQNQPADAEGLFREAIKLDPTDPQPKLSLATALAMQGKMSEANEVGEAGIAQLSPEKRAAAHEALQRAVASGMHSPPPPTAQ